MLVKLFKLGEDEVVTTFPLGSHVLGRGTSLQCNDKRISRNHATIEITPDNITLTSIHVNPCFLRAAESKTITILKKDTSKQLNDGDNFALLPDDFWFKIKICADVLSEVETSKVTSKRSSYDCDDEAPPDKKMKTEIANLDATNPPMEEREANLDESEENGLTVEATANSQVESKHEEDPSLKEETDETKEAVADNYDVPENVEVQDDNGSQTDQVTPKQDQDDHASADKDDGQPGTSNPRPKRERCWYGAQCYRKNPVHRQDYTHPGDSDYESDADDNRPTCSYGAACYRKHKDHRRDYKHPPRQPPSKKKRNRKKVDRLNVADSEEMREFDDSEDPFLADDDSDEYIGDSDEDDSDWDESQEQDEDSENVKRLVKEANRFVKK